MLICHYCNRRFFPDQLMEQNEWHRQEGGSSGIDHGNQPYVVDIDEASVQNENFRTIIWTGEHLQVSLMSIDQEIGLECHPDVDQFLRIEKGNGIVRMGNSRNNLLFERTVEEDDAIFVPAGIWHNLINTGNEPIKLYSIYAPPEHPFGTIHKTKAEADEAENY